MINSLTDNQTKYSMSQDKPKTEQLVAREPILKYIQKMQGSLTIRMASTKDPKSISRLSGGLIVLENLENFVKCQK